MKYFLTMLVSLVLLGCGNEPVKLSGPMTGEKMNLKVHEYDQMCEREPEHLLCKNPEKENDQ